MNSINKKTWIPAFAGMTIAFFFSFFLMFHTFSYDVPKQELRIASKLWSDFGAHIPLIRSFSYGPNLDRLVRLQAVESPLFPGEPIRYHFGFYAAVGLLERLGIRIDWALNSMSALGLGLLMVMIFLVSYTLFSSVPVSLLSVTFFLFNGSLSFVQFFRQQPLSVATITDILTNSKFPAFGPWDNGNITAFWTLNIYTNQRHLALSYGLLLGIIHVMLQSKKTLRTGLIAGILLSILVFSNFAVAGIALLFLGWIALTRRESRAPGAIAAIPLLISYGILRHVSTASSSIAWQPGYLIHPSLTIYSFAIFWWENIGLHSILIPLGILLAPKTIRRHLGVPLLLLFILPNMLRFSPDMINNHKFFNFFLVLGNMFSASALIRLLRAIPGIMQRTWLTKTIQFTIGATIIVALTFSGIIDFFPIINDTKGPVQDISRNADAQFFLTHTDPSDTIANSTWFYHPASIAGRPLYSGYTYFTWSYGYHQGAREEIQKAIYTTSNQNLLCTLLTKNNISYVELSATQESFLTPISNLWNVLIPMYTNPDTGLRIYNTNMICGKI